jgi:PEP-CTERM motif
MMTITRSALLFALLTTAGAHATIIGVEGFTYADGAINSLAGGTGWDRVGGTSAWGSSGSQILGGKLITDANVGAFREYGADEGASAVQATGQVFFQFSLTFGAAVANYAGLSSFDFGTEKVFFGRTFLGNFGIDETGVGNSLSGVAAQANTSYTLVGVLDFANDLLSLYINPDGLDVYDPTGPSGPGNTADVVRTGFTSTNWSTQIRIQSGDQGAGVAPVQWDNVTVATAPQDVGLQVPEPTTLGLLALGGLLSFARRRR